MRGNPGMIARNRAACGPIPACAGQPIDVLNGLRNEGAYPRVCGATWPGSWHAFCPWGLSPRVRGNPPSAEDLSHAERPIPACAGQPGSAVPHYPGGGAYPRVCGATSSSLPTALAALGLSPRVRGNRNQLPRQFALNGPIPACAGQPLPRSWPSWPVTAYPRVCGATPVTESLLPTYKGLSPRVRGNLGDLGNVLVLAGPIPACAGQPGGQCGPLSARRAYPRVCGATSLWTDQDICNWGLSPRVRGNPTCPCTSSAASWPIPACAGQPKDFA